MFSTFPATASARRTVTPPATGAPGPAPRNPLDPASITLPTTHSVDLDLRR